MDEHFVIVIFVIVIIVAVIISFIGFMLFLKKEEEIENIRIDRWRKEWEIEKERLRNHPLFLNRESIAQERYKHRCRDGIPGDSNEDWYIAGQVIEKRLYFLESGRKVDGFEVYNWCYPTNHKPGPQIDEWYDGCGYQITGAVGGFLFPTKLYTRVA